MQYAGRVISRRMISQKELFDKLTEKGAAYEDAEYVINRFLELRLLDDTAYAGAVVRHYAAKGYGYSRIRSELKRHGIPEDLYEEAFREMPDTSDKINAYIRSHLSDSHDRKEVSKVSAALARRGFSWDEINSAIRRYEE